MKELLDEFEAAVADRERKLSRIPSHFEVEQFRERLAETEARVKASRQAIEDRLKEVHAG